MILELIKMRWYQELIFVVVRVGTEIATTGEYYARTLARG